MSDYISKSALIKAIDEQVQGWGKQGVVPSLFSAIAIVQNQPTFDEKEIIRKAFERVIQQLSEQMPIKFNGFGKTLITVEDVIKILQEECGINE